MDNWKGQVGKDYKPDDDQPWSWISIPETIGGIWLTVWPYVAFVAIAIVIAVALLPDVLFWMGKKA